MLRIFCMKPVFIFKTNIGVGIFEIKYNGKHWTSFHTLDCIKSKSRIIEKAKEDLREEGLKNPEIKYNCPYW